MNSNYGNLKVCPICEKRFITTFHWQYVIPKIGTGKKYYCTYGCYKKAGGDNTKKHTTKNWKWEAENGRIYYGAD